HRANGLTRAKVPVDSEQHCGKPGQVMIEKLGPSTPLCPGVGVPRIERDGRGRRKAKYPGRSDDTIVRSGLPCERSSWPQRADPRPAEFIRSRVGKQTGHAERETSIGERWPYAQPVLREGARLGVVHGPKQLVNAAL